MTALRPPKYSAAQRAAVFAARERGDTGVRVAALAASGQLRDGDGRRIPKFTIPEASVRDLARRERRRRAREAMEVELADRPHKDAVEVLRRQLVDLCQTEIGRLKKKQRRTGALTGLEVQQWTRALIDLARLPGPADERPPAENVPDARPGRAGLKGVTSSPRSPAGSLMRAHRGEIDPNRPPPPSLPVDPPADYQPQPVDEEEPVVDPGVAIAETLREEIERAAARNGDPDGYGA